MTTKRIKLSEIELIGDLFNQYRMFYSQSSDLTGALKYLTERLQDDQSIVIAAIEHDALNSRPVGFLQLYPIYSSVSMTRNWILNDLFVDPAFRGNGIGTMLIQAAKEFAKESGAMFLQLETAKENHNAQRLYETIGFDRQAPDSDFYLYKISLE